MTRPPITLVVAAGTAGASAIVALFALLGPAAPDGGAFGRILSGLAWLGAALALGFASAHVREVLEHQRVLGARVAPRAASRAAARSSLHGIAGGGLALALPVVALALVLDATPGVGAEPPASPVPWPGRAAAGLTAAGLVHALAWLGVLAWWGRAHLAWLALAGAAASTLAALGWAGVLLGLAQAPWLAVPALAGAALATRRVHRALWSDAAAPDPVRTRSPRQRAREAVGSLKTRFARVDPVAVPLLALLPGQMLPALTREPPRDSLLLVSWGSPFDLAGVARVALLAAGMCLCLRTGALHWRMLLAPGGRSRDALGPDVVLRSWVPAVAVLALLVAIVFPIAVLVGEPRGDPASTALAWVGEVALRFGPTLLCELLLATALAACVRPLARSSVAACAMLVAAAFAVFVGSVALDAFAGTDPAPGWPRGLAHHLGVLALAAAFTLLARHIWRRADLRRLVAPDPRGAGRWAYTRLRRRATPSP